MQSTTRLCRFGSTLALTLGVSSCDTGVTREQYKKLEAHDAELRGRLMHAQSQLEQSRRSCEYDRDELDQARKLLSRFASSPLAFPGPPDSPSSSGSFVLDLQVGVDEVRVGGDVLSTAELDGRVRAVLDQHAWVSVVVQVEPEVPYRQLVAALEELKAAGAQDVSLAEPVPPAGP